MGFFHAFLLSFSDLAKLVVFSRVIFSGFGELEHPQVFNYPKMKEENLKMI
jgi:hypothetical protein